MNYNGNTGRASSLLQAEDVVCPSCLYHNPPGVTACAWCKQPLNQAIAAGVGGPSTQPIQAPPTQSMQYQPTMQAQPQVYPPVPYQPPQPTPLQQIIPPTQLQPQSPQPVTQVIYTQPQAQIQPTQPLPYPSYAYPQPTTQMNVVMNAPGYGYGYPPPAAFAPRKSVGVAVLLSFLFGPLGMFYSTVGGALLMLLVGVAMSILWFLPQFVFQLYGNNPALDKIMDWGIFLRLNPGWWIAIVTAYFLLCILWAGVAAASYNNKMAMRYR